MSDELQESVQKLAKTHNGTVKGNVVKFGGKGAHSDAVNFLKAHTGVSDKTLGAHAKAHNDFMKKKVANGEKNSTDTFHKDGSGATHKLSSRTARWTDTGLTQTNAEVTLGKPNKSKANENLEESENLIDRIQSGDFSGEGGASNIFDNIIRGKIAKTLPEYKNEVAKNMFADKGDSE